MSERASTKGPWRVAHSNPTAPSLSSLRKGAEVAVKPLEWRAIERARSDEDPRTEETGDHEATSPFGEYYIECGFGSDSYVWSVSFCGDFLTDKDDPEAAKSAAQSDFETRIRSALVSGSREDGE